MVNLTELSIIFVADQMKLSYEYSLMNSIVCLYNLKKLHINIPHIDFKEKILHNPLELPIFVGLKNLLKLTSLDLKLGSKNIG